MHGIRQMAIENWIRVALFVVQGNFHVSGAGGIFEIQQGLETLRINRRQVEAFEQFVGDDSAVNAAFFGFGEQVNSAYCGRGACFFLRLGV